MNTKVYIIIAGATVVVLAGAVSLAFAENSMMGQNSTAMPVTQMHGDGGQQVMLQVGPKGEALMRGTIIAVGATSLTVKSWGGDWTVNVSADTNLSPLSDITQFVVGGFVGVKGMVSQSASWTIDAKILHSWTAKKMMPENSTMGQSQDHNGNQQNENPKKMQGPQGGEGSGDIQQKIQSILEQIKRIQAQIGAPQGQTAPSTQPVQ